MKNIILFFLVLTMVITSCKKDKDEDIKLPPLETVTDANGNVYNVVTIGTQKWMATNIKVNTPDSYIYDNNTSNANTYGRLYTWEAAKTACPSGWRLPTESDFGELVSHLGGNTTAGGKMKNAGTSYWQSPNTGADNSSGYNALPAGYRNHTDGVFFGKGMYTYFWTSKSCMT